MEFKSSSMAINIKDSTKMENSMVKESIFGQMNHATKANLLRELDMGKAAGNQRKTTQISILEHIWMIRKTAMGDTYGQMVAFMKVVS